MKGEPTKGAQLTNEQMLRLNDDDLQRLGERMASRTGVWANEPTHYLAIVLGHLRRTRAERDEALAALADAQEEMAGPEVHRQLLAAEIARDKLLSAIKAHAEATYTLETVQAPDWAQYIDSLEVPLYRAAGLLLEPGPQENRNQ